MADVLPPLARSDGKAIDKLSAQAVDGSTYQGWSRHYDWREDVNTLMQRIPKATLGR